MITRLYQCTVPVPDIQNGSAKPPYSYMKLPKPYLIGKSNIEDVEAKSLEKKNFAKKFKVKYN